MEVCRRHPLAAPVEQARQLVRASDRLVEWLPVRHLRIDDAEVELVFDGPRPLRLRMVVRPTASGVRWDLVQGDVSALSGSIELEEVEGRTVLTWRFTLDPGVVVPGPLLRELEEEVLLRWTRAIDATLTPT